MARVLINPEETSIPQSNSSFCSFLLLLPLQQPPSLALQNAMLKRTVLHMDSLIMEANTYYLWPDEASKKVNGSLKTKITKARNWNENP